MLSLRNGRLLFHELGTSWEGTILIWRGSDEFIIGFWDVHEIFGWGYAVSKWEYYLEQRRELKIEVYIIGGMGKTQWLKH